MSDERFIIEEVEVLSVEAIQNNETKGEEWIAVTDTEVLQSFCVRNEEEAEELCKLLNELASENEQLRKERDYWEQSSKHRQRLLEDSEKELRLHNAYLIDNNQAEDYQRWRRSNK